MPSLESQVFSRNFEIKLARCQNTVWWTVLNYVQVAITAVMSMPKIITNWFICLPVLTVSTDQSLDVNLITA